MCLDRVKDKKYKNCLNVYLMGLTATYLLNEYSNGYRVFDQMIFFFITAVTMGFKRRWNQKDGKQIDMCRNSGIVAIFDDLQNSSQVRKNIMKKVVKRGM